MKAEKRAWLVETSGGVFWFVSATTPRVAMDKVYLWSNGTETAVRCEAL